MSEGENERDFLLWAIDSLMEINPSNYDHENVCEMNAASVEVILAMRARLSALPARAEPDISLQYRPLTYDDWGQIRRDDGSLFACVSRPLEQEEADAHRAAKTDPYEPLARALMAGLSAPSLTAQLEAERERATKAEAALREKAMEYLALDQQATEALARAATAEEEVAYLRHYGNKDCTYMADQALSRWREAGRPDDGVAPSGTPAALKTGEPSHD